MPQFACIKILNKNPKSVIVFDKKYKIKSFTERPQVISNNKNWSNASMYILEPEIFNFIPVNRTSDFGKDVFPQIISRGYKMFAYINNDYFIDIGNNDKLKQAEKDLREGKFKCY